MTTDPHELVRAGYDRIAEAYLTWSDQIAGDPWEHYLRDLVARLPEPATVLDLGCGAGVPSTALLAEHAQITGVDLSERQLTLAREWVPAAHLVRSDMAVVEFRPSSFDAVTALYSILHLPRYHHGALFRRIASWLRPGGHVLVVLGAESMPGSVEDDWLGVPMYFSSYDAPTNRRLITDADVTVLVDDLVTIREPGGRATFQWVLAQKPQRPVCAGH